MLQKRYQYRGPHGIEWTKWFKINRPEKRTKRQPGNGLLQEFREVPD